MSGLIDVTTGLNEGTGLIIQAVAPGSSSSLGGLGGLGGPTHVASTLDILASDSAIIFASDADYIVTVS